MIQNLEIWRHNKRKKLLPYHTVATTFNMLVYISFDFKKIYVYGYLFIFPEDESLL